MENRKMKNEELIEELRRLADVLDCTDSTGMTITDEINDRNEQELYLNGKLFFINSEDGGKIVDNIGALNALRVIRNLDMNDKCTEPYERGGKIYEPTPSTYNINFDKISIDGELGFKVSIDGQPVGQGAADWVDGFLTATNIDVEPIINTLIKFIESENSSADDIKRTVDQ